LLLTPSAALDLFQWWRLIKATAEPLYDEIGGGSQLVG
jgi:hypothetical protein